jgi:hypothetical protein
VAITLSDKGFQQMSFVNSIATTKVINKWLMKLIIVIKNFS